MSRIVTVNPSFAKKKSPINALVATEFYTSILPIARLLNQYQTSIFFQPNHFSFLHHYNILSQTGFDISNKSPIWVRNISSSHSINHVLYPSRSNIIIRALQKEQQSFLSITFCSRNVLFIIYNSRQPIQ